MIPIIFYISSLRWYVELQKCEGFLEGFFNAHTSNHCSSNLLCYCLAIRERKHAKRLKALWRIFLATQIYIYIYTYVYTNSPPGSRGLRRRPPPEAPQTTRGRLMNASLKICVFMPEAFIFSTSLEPFPFSSCVVVASVDGLMRFFCKFGVLSLKQQPDIFCAFVLNFTRWLMSLKKFCIF